jgi:AcrR family transcriptional regulator
MSFSASQSPLAVATRPDRFVTAARDLANETGSAAFTVAQLTSRAGLSLKAFYVCFRGKDEVLLALLAADSQIGAEVLAGQIGDRKGPDGVRAYVVELFDLVTLPGALGYAGVLVREYARLREHYDRELRAALAPLVDLLASHLGSSPSRPADPRDAETMFGVLLAGIHDVVMGRIDDVRAHAEYLHRFCTQGVAG